MKILLLEPFLGGSHQQWAIGYQQYSQQEISILGMKGHHWKWRMHGGAVSLSQQLADAGKWADVLLATDMLNLSTFLGLARKQVHHLPVAIYFHENQITYPWSPVDQDVKLRRDNHYGFMNYTSALAADTIFFNSPFHRSSFLESLTPFLKQFPDRKELHLVENIKAKSKVLPLGMDLKVFDQYQPALPSTNQLPTIVWNHRWEYDKAPEDFFEMLYRLKADNCAFKLIVLGASYPQQPTVFEEAKDRLKEEIVHWGYADSKKAYAEWLWQADILAVTSRQDFFGGSVVEAIYCNCFPLLPNRLAYPMHIPEHKWKDHLYDSSEEGYQKLKKLVANYPESLQSRDYQHFVAQYDWSKLAALYDDEMLKLSNEYGE
jgi:glycosyltransferase involved in cell wall biosynthesis